MFSGESQSWEDAQLVMISHDIQLLNSFQTLKYMNGKLSQTNGFNERSLITDF